MSFPKHNDYKEVESGWLAQVPAHWDALPCRAIVKERTERNGDGECQDYLSLMANVGIIPYEDKGDVGNKKPEDLSKCKRVRVGDFVINSMNYYIGSYGVSPYDGVCSPVYVVMTPDRQVVEPRFAFRIFEDKQFQEHAQSFGNGILEHRRSISWDILKRIHVPVPPLEEQKAIAAFLDRETSKIDALVAEQRRLIELLQEKRQAVISHAVTKGLDPGVRMKPSGIEWLGDVPEHWEVVRLKLLIETGTSISYGIVQPGEPLEDGVPFVQTTNMTTGEFSSDSLQRTTPEISSQYPRSTLSGGEVLLGIRASIGAAHVVPSFLAGANLSRGVARIVPNERICSEYLVAFLRSDVTSRYWGLSQQGSTFNEVSIATVKDLPVAVPSRREQKLITNYVASESREFDELILLAEQSITLLHDRRTALISAAVTGKIDVREVACQEV